MIPQIADGADSQSLGFASAHDQSVGVVEAERISHADAETRQPFPYLRERSRFLDL